MAGDQLQVVADDDVGVFVGLDADAVAGAVHEELAVAGVVDHPAGGGVDVLAGRADRRRGDPGRLGGLEHVVQLGERRRGLAQVHAAGDVGAVADAVVAVHRAADVEQHALPLADDPVAGLVVRAGGIGPGGHDREVDLAVALVEDPLSDLGGHLGLGPPGQRHPAGLDVGEDPVDGGSGAAQGLDLGGVLHHPQRGRDRRGPDETRPGQLGQQVHEEPGPRLVAEGGRVDGTDQAGGQGHGVLPVAPGDQLEHAGPFDHPGRLEVRDEQVGVTLPGHDQQGEALERHGLVAAQPRQVGPGREQQHVDTTLAHGDADPFEALGEHAGEPRGWPSGASCPEGDRDGRRGPDGVGGLAGVVAGAHQRPGLDHFVAVCLEIVQKGRADFIYAGHSDLASVTAPHMRAC